MCPSELVYGSAAADSPFSNAPIPANTDMSFDVVVESCNNQPHASLAGEIGEDDYEAVGGRKIGYCYKFKQGAKVLRNHADKLVVEDANPADENQETDSRFIVVKGVEQHPGTVGLES